MIRRPPRSTRVRSSAASDVYKRQIQYHSLLDRACDGMLIRAHENAARGHIAFSHFGDAAAVLSARVLVNKRWHASISQGSCICTSHTCTSALPCMRYTTCRCTYARAAQCTPTRAVGHIIPANEPRRRSTAWLQPPHASIQWPKLVFSATADCALHPYVSTTYRRPIPRTCKPGRVFARRRRKFWKFGSETVEF